MICGGQKKSDFTAGKQVLDINGVNHSNIRFFAAFVFFSGSTGFQIVENVWPSTSELIQLSTCFAVFLEY